MPVSFKEFIIAESLDEACWKNYTMVGMKKKDGREVPNCVPKKGVPKMRKEDASLGLMDDDDEPDIHHSDSKARGYAQAHKTAKEVYKKYLSIMLDKRGNRTVADEKRVTRTYQSMRDWKDAYHDRLKELKSMKAEEAEDRPHPKGARIPLHGHPYHKKSEAELRYIRKDAGEAARAMKGHNPRAEAKYLDQVNDAETVLHYRSKGGKRVVEEAEQMDEALPPPDIRYAVNHGDNVAREHARGYKKAATAYNDAHAKLASQRREPTREQEDELANHYERAQHHHREFKKRLAQLSARKNEDLDEGIVKTVVRSLTGRAEAARRAKTHYDQGDDIWGGDEGKKFRRNYKAARNYDRIATGNRSVKFGTRKNEDLQEISKPTLLSYLARARGNRNAAANRRDVADEKWEKANKAYRDGTAKTAHTGDYHRQTMKIQSSVSKAADRIIDKRTKGIAAARARLSKEEDINEGSAAWQRKEGKNPEGGLNRKGVESYRRENPGSKLQMAVTTKPSKLKPGSKAAKRRKSFCARMGGMEGPMKDEKGRPTRKALSLRKWNC